MKLFETVRIYVERKKSLGAGFDKGAQGLRSFSKRLGDVPLDTITPGQILAFLDGPRTSRITWRVKFNLLRHFFDYWAARGLLQASPMPKNRPPVPQTFVPYIYQKTEIRGLLSKTRTSQKLRTCGIDARTLRMAVLFLYATGVLVGEAVRLSIDDVSLEAGFIAIRGGRFNRERRIPIGQDLRARLRRYMQWRKRRKAQAKNLFTYKNGHPIRDRVLAASFQRLRRLAGIRRHDDALYQPRMHDLRYTFAVHRLASWLKQGADLNRLLPALAAYMGQVGLGSTERYLTLTPERFRKQLSKLSPTGRRKRWRDDAGLMKFLDEL
jgi:site-specific recombinase XerD